MQSTRFFAGSVHFWRARFSPPPPSLADLVRGSRSRSIPHPAPLRGCGAGPAMDGRFSRSRVQHRCPPARPGGGARDRDARGKGRRGDGSCQRHRARAGGTLRRRGDEGRARRRRDAGARGGDPLARGARGRGPGRSHRRLAGRRRERARGTDPGAIRQRSSRLQQRRGLLRWPLLGGVALGLGVGPRCEHLRRAPRDPVLGAHPARAGRARTRGQHRLDGGADHDAARARTR